MASALLAESHLASSLALAFQRQLNRRAYHEYAPNKWHNAVQHTYYQVLGGWWLANSLLCSPLSVIFSQHMWSLERPQVDCQRQLLRLGYLHGFLLQCPPRSQQAMLPGSWSRSSALHQHSQLPRSLLELSGSFLPS